MKTIKISLFLLLGFFSLQGQVTKDSVTVIGPDGLPLLVAVTDTSAFFSIVNGAWTKVRAEKIKDYITPKHFPGDAPTHGQGLEYDTTGDSLVWQAFAEWQELQDTAAAIRADIGTGSGTPQTLTFTNPNLSISDGNSVDLSGLSGSSSTISDEAWLFILAGQSNALGQGDRDSLALSEKNMKSRLSMFSGVDFVPLHINVGDNSFPLSDSYPTHFGPEQGIEAKLSTLDSNAYMVKYAVGSTSISTWLPGTENYRILTNQRITPAIKELFSQNKKVKPVLFWMQGENDGLAGVDTAALYQTRFQLLVDSLRSRYGNDMPVIAGNIITNVANSATINAAIDAVADKSIDVNNGSYPNDGLHFYVEGYKQLGQSFVDSLLAVTAPTAKEVLTDTSNYVAPGFVYESSGGLLNSGGSGPFLSTDVLNVEEDDSQFKFVDNGLGTQFSLINNDASGSAMALSVSNSSNSVIYANSDPFVFYSDDKADILANSFGTVTEIARFPTSTGSAITLSAPVNITGSYLTGSYIFTTSNNGVIGSTTESGARFIVSGTTDVFSGNGNTDFRNDSGDNLVEIFNDGSMSVGKSATFTGGDGVLNVVTGFRIANAATDGNYLRGNGTNFVSSAIQQSDLPAPTTGSGAPGTTPSVIGEIYIDTSGGSGSQVIYMAAGTSSSSDWIQISN